MRPPHETATNAKTPRRRVAENHFGRFARNDNEAFQQQLDMQRASQVGPRVRCPPMTAPMMMLFSSLSVAFRPLLAFATPRLCVASKIGHSNCGLMY